MQKLRCRREQRGGSLEQELAACSGCSSPGGARCAANPSPAADSAHGLGQNARPLGTGQSQRLLAVRDRIQREGEPGEAGKAPVAQAELDSGQAETEEFHHGLEQSSKVTQPS